MDGDLSKAILFDMETSLKNMLEARDKWNGVLNTVEEICKEREGGWPRSTLFVVIVSIDADYKDVNHPECMGIGYIFMFAISMWPFFIADSRVSQASLSKSLRIAY